MTVGACRYRLKSSGSRRAVEDVAQQRLVARAEEDGVVREVRGSGGRPEVEDEQGHRPVHALEAAAPSSRPRGSPAVEVRVGVVHVGVETTRSKSSAPASVVARGGPVPSAVRRLDAPRPAIASRSSPPSSSKRRTSAAHQRAGAAPREEHAPLLLEVVDQRVDGAGLERVAAHEQRVERQGLAEVLVLHEARPRRRTPSGRRAGARGRGATRTMSAKRRNGSAGQLLVALHEDRRGVVHEAR